MVLRFGCTERVNDSMVVIFELLRALNIVLWCWDFGVPKESYKRNNQVWRVFNNPGAWRMLRILRAYHPTPTNKK